MAPFSQELEPPQNSGRFSVLVQAAVKQVAHSLSDEGHDVAALTSNRLLSAGPPKGLLYGPRSTKYGTD
ncbi:GNA1162 family protein [Burkholderia sp. LMG 32019]|uniref:GNA1162 family protein n=1 Tax=Burkholderia sp. LMG 32019 TaxID=3158173 RepID=UPI003C2FF7D9